MPNFINRQDLEFLLHEVGGLDELLEQPRFAEHDRAGVSAMLDLAEQIGEARFQPCAGPIDANPPTFDGDRVHIPDAMRQAVAAYCEAGLMGASFPEEHGGLQTPYLVSSALGAILTGANPSLMAYPSLTTAAANLILVQGSDEQKARYLQPMLESRFFGTMCLSEPQAGSSLGDIRTKAIRDEDGSWRLEGSKMWISAGEHDMAENIIHLVLARTEDAPPGSRGISLFIVPRNRVDENGQVGALNHVTLAGLNHKMGQRGSINCVLNFGDSGPCRAELVGEVNKGLAGMFQMMNEARIAVGLAAAMTGYAGYLEALAYAKERLQGRPVTDPDPAKPPVPIIEHADVRRMLLAQKAYVEGSLALVLYCGELIDRESVGSEADRHRAGRLLAYLTPIAKAWPSDYALKANELAVQVLGGYGYTPDYPAERLYRDNRINAIHEGTNGIQSLDLLGRKLPMENGALLRTLVETIGEDIARAESAGLTEEAAAVAEAVDRLVAVSRRLLAIHGEHGVEVYLANSYVYLELAGHTVIAWMWLRQARAAAARETQDAFTRGKRQAARYFLRWELPKTQQWAAILESADRTCLDMEAAWF